MDDDDVGFELDDLLCKQSRSVEVTAGPAIIQVDIAALRSTELFESVLQCFNARLCFWVAFIDSHQHTDPRHPAGLCSRDNRPRYHRPSNKPDEIPP